MRHDKKDGNYIEIPGTFTSSTGAMADPGTSFKVYIFPANSETATVNGDDLDKVGAIVGQYSYTWDITNVAVGHYYGYLQAVDTAINYGTSFEIDITISLTAATIAGAVFDETLSGHTTAGTAGAVMPFLDQYVSKAGLGEGDIEAPIHTDDATGNALGGVSVYLTSDIAGLVKVTDTKLSNSKGLVTFFLNAGIYYVWMFAESNTWQNPGQITVV